MKEINKIKDLSIWIFIVPFVAVNLCLLIVTNFHGILPPEAKAGNVFPYIDGGLSISRTARFFPTYLIFKPAMFLTSYFLIIYWRTNFNLMKNFNANQKFINYFLFFGVGSAICLVLHSIFLGIKFDIAIYKFVRRFVLLCFILFEVTAQAYLVITLYKIKEEINNFINAKILKIKIVLVSVLIIVGVLVIPIVSMPGNKFLKHALEWDYFIGVIAFYLLTFFMWKKK